MQVAKDIMVANIPAPGMDQLGRRLRQQAHPGIIPPEDMTDEEKQKMQQAQSRPPQEDPMMVAARAEGSQGTG